VSADGGTPGSFVGGDQGGVMVEDESSGSGSTASYSFLFFFPEFLVAHESEILVARDGEQYQNVSCILCCCDDFFTALGSLVPG
jgi:hypothetical protein